MRTRTIFTCSLITGLFLITSCNGLTTAKTTSTPDPCSKEVLETVVGDFEDLKNELVDLAAAAEETPVEELEPIVLQMLNLEEEIAGYEFPLCAAKAQSALYSYSFHTEQCYLGQYAEYINQVSHPEDVAYRCEQAEIFEETVDLMLQELKEMIAAK